MQRHVCMHRCVLRCLWNGRLRRI